MNDEQKDQQPTAEPTVEQPPAPAPIPIVVPPMTSKPRRILPYILGGIVTLLLMACVLCWALWLAKNNTPDPMRIMKNTAIQNTPNSTPNDTQTTPPANIIATPLHSSSMYQGWSISIASIDTNLKTTGSAPDPGMHYVEIHFKATNNSGTEGSIPGNFFYQSPDKKLYYGLGWLGTNDSDPTQPMVLNKSVMMTDSQGNSQQVSGTIQYLTVRNGVTDSSGYDFYQIPNDNSGLLTWYDSSFFYSNDPTNSAKELAAFSLK